MIFSSEQSKALAEKLEQLLEGSAYILIINDGTPRGTIENQLLTNMPPDDQKEFLREMLSVIESE